MYSLTVTKISVPIWVENMNKSNWSSTVCWISSRSPVMLSSGTTTLLPLFSNGEGRSGSTPKRSALSTRLSTRFSANGLLGLSIPFNHIWLGVQLPSVPKEWLLCNSLNLFNAWIILCKNTRRRAIGWRFCDEVAATFSSFFNHCITN